MTMAGCESKEDIGIIGMEAYFPKYYVDQKELGKKLVINLTLLTLLRAS